MDTSAEQKLSAARTRLIIDKPFLGTLVLRLPLINADPKWCHTTATDAKSLYFNEEYIDSLSLKQCQFVLAHEALHCALSHFSRRQHRIKHRWDIACDYAINSILLAEQLAAPLDILIDKQFDGMTAEEIYPYIDDASDEQPMDQHLYDGQGDSEQQSPIPQQASSQNSDAEQNPQEQDEQKGGNLASQPPPLNNDERKNLETQWQQRLAGAAQQAMQAGKLSKEMMRMVDFLLQPRLPWRMLLARYLSNIAREDYSYSRLSNRRGDPAIFPSLRSAQINLTVALDVSGSIKDKELEEFLSEINALKAQLRARVTLLACDAELDQDGPWIFEPWEEFILPKSFQGCGGTDFTPIFDWVELQDVQADLLIYFTDAQGKFPKQAPHFPVIWLVKGKQDVPWGQRIQLN